MSPGPSFDGEGLPSLGNAQGKYGSSRTEGVPNTFASVIDVIHNYKNTHSNGTVSAYIQLGNGSTRIIQAAPMSPHSFTCPIPNEKIHVIQDGKTKKWFYTALQSNGYRLNWLANVDEGLETFRDGQKELFTGHHFLPSTEKSRLPYIYEGDTIIAGRSGGSIRLATSTVKVDNVWSKSSKEEASPFISIRNGVLPVENLELDYSSIYLTSDQHIKLSLPVTLPSQIESAKDRYDHSQIIMNSDRIVLSSRSNDVLVASNETIQLCTPNWQHDVDIVLDVLKELVTEVKKLTTEVKNQALVSSTQTFPVPGAGTSLISTRSGDYMKSFNNTIGAETRIQRIIQKLEALQQKP